MESEPELSIFLTVGVDSELRFFQKTGSGAGSRVYVSFHENNNCLYCLCSFSTGAKQKLEVHIFAKTRAGVKFFGVKVKSDPKIRTSITSASASDSISLFKISHFQPVPRFIKVATVFY